MVGRHGLRRRFGPGVLDQLALVALGQAAGCCSRWTPTSPRRVGSVPVIGLYALAYSATAAEISDSPGQGSA